MNKKISFISLIFLIVSGIDNLKNLPATASFGSDLLFFFTLAALLFLLPSALVSADLSTLSADKGGIYHWVKLAFGKRWAMVAIWLQWINTMVWYPTMLTFIAAAIAYIIHPELVHSKIYLATTSVGLFWLLTWANLKGIKMSALLNNILATCGMALPLLLLILFGIIWCFMGNPLHLQFNKTQWLPNLATTSSWVSLISIMASFLGVELSGVHINDINKPQKNFPRAVLCSCLFIFLTMLLGSLSIAAVLPKQEIDLVSGVMQVFAKFLDAFHLAPWTPILTLLIALGATGTMINWVISPAKGLSHAAENGFLPPFFLKKNKAGVPSNLLLAQAVVVTFFSLFFLLEPRINSYFWFLTALSTELYMLMYILMFCASLRLRFRQKKSLGLTCVLGILGCLLTITISFFPPEGLQASSRYFMMICLGNGMTLAPLLFFFLYAKRKEIKILKLQD